jgi:hypothetical protein
MPPELRLKPAQTLAAAQRVQIIAEAVLILENKNGKP